MRHVSHKSCTANHDTHFVFLFLYYHFDIIWKNMEGQSGHRRPYNTAHALCIPDTNSDKHTLRICNTYRGADKSLAGPGRKQARWHVRDARDFSNIETRAVIKLFFFPLQGKEPKEIHAILTGTLACFLPGRAKDLSAPLYCFCTATLIQRTRPSVR